MQLCRRNYMTHYESPHPPLNKTSNHVQAYFHCEPAAHAVPNAVECEIVTKHPERTGWFPVTFPTSTCREKPKYHHFGNTDRENLKSCTVSAVLNRYLFLISRLYTHYVETIILSGRNFTRTINSSYLPLRNMLSPTNFTVSPCILIH